jgi:lysophospholipase L1-like esterase
MQGFRIDRLSQSMKLNRICLALITMSGVVRSQSTLPTTMPTIAKSERADVAAMKLRDGKPDEQFLKMHESFLARGKSSQIGVLFLGDSITNGWFWGNNREIWNDHFGKYNPANFGIGADLTQHVLWRIDHGELDGIHPKVVVLLIGTNNIGYADDEIVAGVEKIAAEIHEKLPDAKLLLMGIFPRGADPKIPEIARVRAKIKTVNAPLAKLDDGNKTRFLDIGDQFLSSDGSISKSIMPDALHPNYDGYKIWADAMQPLLDEMMN